MVTAKATAKSLLTMMNLWAEVHIVCDTTFQEDIVHKLPLEIRTNMADAEGNNAFWAKSPSTACPYPQNTPEYESWIDGWTDAWNIKQSNL